MTVARPATPSTGPLGTFGLDVQYTRIAPVFAAARIRAILLKGPAFDQLLYGGKRARTYSDIDVLVDPRRIRAAERLLGERGFRPDKQRSAVRRLAERACVAAGVLSASEATPWVRDGFTVDLHDTLPHVGAQPLEVWQALIGHVVAVTVAGAEVETLDGAGSALLVALHAVHHGPRWNRARTDLQRACEVLERDCWQAAAKLAHDLRGERAMGVGLGTAAEGAALARELRLQSSPRVADRLRWAGVAVTERRRAA